MTEWLEEVYGVRVCFSEIGDPRNGCWLKPNSESEVLVHPYGVITFLRLDYGLNFGGGGQDVHQGQWRRWWSWVLRIDGNYQAIPCFCCGNGNLTLLWEKIHSVFETWVNESLSCLEFSIKRKIPSYLVTVTKRVSISVDRPKPWDSKIFCRYVIRDESEEST